MAIYGTIDTCAAQVGHRPHFAATFDFLNSVLDGTHQAARQLADLPEGQLVRVNLAGKDGTDAYALLQHPRTRPRGAQQAEAHRDYADVQAVIDGDEILEVIPLAGLDTTQPYDASKDVALFNMPADGSKLIMRRGLCAVLFPEDAHAPLQAPDGIPRPSRRIVVKVRVAP
ncbi:MAG: YhcH/YjgK/YiaL family protein [Chloroflexi bacterium]|nr:YhcH/YjgK/YiaL family protein [Chloroflexota bacterium]